MDKGTKIFLWHLFIVGIVTRLLGKSQGQGFLGAFIAGFGMFFLCYIFYRGVLGGESGPFFGSLRDDDE